MTRTSLEQRAAEIVAKLAAGVVRPPLERIEVFEVKERAPAPVAAACASS